VLWQDSCWDLQCFCKFRCVTTNNKVNKRTLQALKSTSAQFNKWHPALIHVLIRRESLSSISYKICETRQIFMFFFTLIGWCVLNLLYVLSCDHYLRIETCSSVQCHLSNSVWLKCFTFFVMWALQHIEMKHIRQKLFVDICPKMLLLVD